MLGRPKVVTSREREWECVFNGIELILCVLAGIAGSVHWMHEFQLDRYLLPSYRQRLSRGKEHITRDVAVGMASMLLRWYLPVLLAGFVIEEQKRTSMAGWLTLLAFAAVVAVLLWNDYRTQGKRPFAFTMRVRRLTCVLAGLELVLALLLRLISIPCYLVYAASPYMVWLAGKIMDPVETRINAAYYEQARRKIRARKDLIVIGITGSFGKTQTKFILKELLCKRYRVLATPASFNTAMGISRVVNDNLKKEHQVFIAEMGAQNVGDIANLVRLTKPKYGLITAIGQQHIDTFGSFANILDTKYELIEGLPEDGVAFFSLDNGYSERLFAKCPREKYAAVVGANEEAYMRATDLQFDSDGMHFTLRCSDGGFAKCATQLLGRFNAQNIALAAAVAHRMGLSMEEIAAGIARLRPFEHKLQLIQGDRIEIDDTLNLYAEGAAEALSVLSEFSGRRVIVTSGIPEPGNQPEDVNYVFGTQMKGCADYVVLVGDRQKMRTIQRGLLSQGFPKGAVQIVSDSNEAEDLVDMWSGKGDVVLREGKPDA